MTQRRPRSSFGSVPGMPSLQIGTPTKSQYEDFRRRHSRQNKDILKDNLQHKETIQALRAELAAVHVEILEVRKENAALRKRLRETHQRVQDNAALAALDQLLAIMPALQSLRETLDQPMTDGPLMNPAPANASTTLVAASIATHPAKTGAIINRLGSLPEGSEVESESDGDGDAMPGRIKLKGRNSGIGSRATRSPPPAGLRPAIPQPVIRESPPTPSSSSSSPASVPTPVASPSRPTKVKRRRESGLLLPQRVESPEAGGETCGETSDWDEGSQVQLSPEDAQALINDEAEVEAAIEDELRVMAIDDGPSEATSLVERNPLVQANPPIQLGDSLSPPLDHLGTSPAMSSMLVSEAALDDDGGRGRRSRRSVNYKEPNLTRKMRKPDGVPVEEALRGGRQSLVASQLPPAETTSSSSAASGTTTGTTTGLAPLTASGHLNGMRRKSVLPKSIATTPSSISDDDNDELPWSDESDEFIPGGMSRTNKRPAGRSPATANSLSLPPIRNGEERSPTPTTNVVPKRSSPRKTDKKNFPSTLSRPTASSSARASAGAARNFTPTGTVKARNALSDTSDNGGRRLGVGIGAVSEIGQKLAADTGGESRGTRVSVGSRRVSSAI